jgi:putative ABC transport system permease protein
MRNSPGGCDRASPGDATIQRTKEIGIRMALGAGRGKVLLTILIDGLLPVLFGISTGPGASLLFSRLLKSSLYGVQPYDPLTVAVAGLLLAVVAMAACLSPAHRATRVNPMVILRCD